MKKILKGTSFFILLLMLVGVLVACSSGDNKDDKKDDEPKGVDTKINGTLTMSGSTSMEKLANIATEAFMIEHPNVIASAEFVGSSAGVEQALAGAVDIGNASRNLKDSEKEAGAVENIVAIDGIAVIVDKANPVTDLTKDQLISVYTGEINNWTEFGGSDQPIEMSCKPIVLVANYGQMREMFNNLITNAIKYNKPNGKVKIIVTIEGKDAIFIVEDTGVGIPEESKQRVFERFYRVDKGRSKKMGGTGLGLSIVKHIVNYYNGSIELDSKVGRGSKFTVRIPMS